jgi:RND family efflux transporter MFP subunit
MAPHDGIIAYRHVEEGEVIGPGTIITQVVDTDRMKIKLSLGEQYIPSLEKNRHYKFTVDAIPTETFESRLIFLSPTADAVTRAFPLELAVDDPDPRMADGMTARVTFPLVNQNKSIKIPSAWLAEENGRIGVFVVREGKALFKAVTLGNYYERKVEIRSGLADQDLVITNPAGLRSGDAVKF